MENLKIKVNSEAESKEAQDLLFKLGYNWFKKGYVEVKTPETIMSFENGALSTGIRGSTNHKEITLPELRDLVVLKRNDVNDRNVTDPEYNANLYLDSKGNLFVFHIPTQKWKESNLNGEEEVMARLKPIEKPMKEYLIKSGDGKYLLTHHDSIGAIEIPDGATKLVSHDYVHLPIMFVKPCANGYSYCYPSGIWSDTILSNIKGRDVFWSRYTQPEELPFIDDEPLQSLNDQYAEIEKVRQSAWQKQEGGSHYKNLKIQPMQYALENKLDYAQANVVKYVTRHKEKNGKEDLLKAIHNIELMIEFYYGGGE